MSNYFSTPDFTGLGKTMMDSASMERNMATEADGYAHRAGLASAAKVKGAGFQADAIKAQGQAQGQASMASGIGSMFSGLAGGLSSMGSSSSTNYNFNSPVWKRAQSQATGFFGSHL